MSKRKTAAPAAPDAAANTLGEAPISAPGALQEVPESSAAKAGEGQPDAPDSLTIKAPRANTKLAAVIEKLKTPEGATIAEMQALTGWQPHSIRGAMAGALKKTFGLTITSTKEARGRVYRSVTPEAEG
jgi:hypothetical protein